MVTKPNIYIYYGIVFETIIAILCIYLQKLNVVFNTRQLNFEHSI